MHQCERECQWIREKKKKKKPKIDLIIIIHKPHKIYWLISKDYSKRPNNYVAKKEDNCYLQFIFLIIQYTPYFSYYTLFLCKLIQFSRDAPFWSGWTLGNLAFQFHRDALVMLE